MLSLRHPICPGVIIDIYNGNEVAGEKQVLMTERFKDDLNVQNGGVLALLQMMQAES